VYRLSNSSVADVARYVAPRVPDSEKGLFMREISLLPILLAFEVNRRIDLIKPHYRKGGTECSMLEFLSFYG